MEIFCLPPSDPRLSEPEYSSSSSSISSSGGLIGFGSMVGTAPAKKDTNILDVLPTEKHICIYNSQYLF